MEPRWNVIRGAVTIFVCVVLLRIAYSVWTEGNAEIAAFLATMKSLGSDGTVEEKTFGLAAFGIVIICVLAVIRILTRVKD